MILSTSSNAETECVSQRSELKNGVIIENDFILSKKRTQREWKCCTLMPFHWGIRKISLVLI